MDPARPNRMAIDLAALRHNFRVVQGLVGPDVRIIPCLKNAAFGMGLTETARALSGLGADLFACGALEDARTLRAAVPEADIVVFGSALPAGVPRLLALGLIPTVHTVEIAEAVSQQAARPERVFVKVDCGRGRLGFPIATAAEAILAIARMPRIVVDGLYTHLPFADETAAPWAQERTDLFNDLVDRLRQAGMAVRITQARSSAGVVQGLRDRSNSVSPGRLLYGYPPAVGGPGAAADFRPMLTALSSQLIHVSRQVAGLYADRVSGATGVIPLGRRDGYAPARSGQAGFALVKGARAPILGVSSEHMVLDLSAISDAAIGDDVVLIGRSGGLAITLADLARWQDTGTNDVLLGLRDRSPRVVTGGGEEP